MNLAQQAEQQAARTVDRGAFRFIPASEMLAGLKPADWLIRKYLESDSLGVWYGAPGTCKTFAILDAACCIATDTAWHGNRVKHGPVLIIIGEGRNGYARRLAAWPLANGVSLENAPLHVSSMATALTDPLASAELQAVVAEFSRTHGAPVLIVVDTLARNFGPGDENSNRDMHTAIDACDALRTQTGAAVVLVHHVGKDASRGARGAGALLGAVDCEVLITRAVDGTLTFEATKMKDGALPAPLTFRLQSVGLGFNDDEGEEVTSAVLVEVAGSLGIPASSAGALGPTQRRILKSLTDEYGRCRDNLQRGGFDPDKALVTTEQWKECLRAEGHHRQVISKTIKTLTDRGLVVIDGYHAIPRGVE